MQKIKLLFIIGFQQIACLRAACVFAFCFMSLASSFAQNSVGIGTISPDPSSVLDLTATDKGFLPPRMTTAQRNAIVSPVEALLIYNTTSQCYEGYNAGTAAWVSFGCIGCTSAPTTANAGIDINPACGLTTATLAGNTATVGTGVWSLVSGTATIITPSSPTSGITGLVVPGIATLRWTIANAPCTASFDDVVITTISCCGGILAITHTIGTVAPESKSVNYGTVTTSLSGASKCWITQNLGSTNQAISADDATDAAAGWYWQFNRKQGYKVGPTPAWTIPSINETSDWLAANDPCNIELGTGWRIPTYTEWENANANGPWANYLDTYNSVLKLHAAGYLNDSNGALVSRGTAGYHWCSSQLSSASGWQLVLHSSISYMSTSFKAYGFSLRCLRD